MTSQADLARQRAHWLRATREFLDGRDFVEVNTPVLFRASTFNPHIAELRTQFVGDGKELSLFLQTSPEHYMKRLLADGCERIYQIAPFFRNGEVGPHHNPEFLGLELYQVGATYTDLMDITEAYVRALAPEDPRFAPAWERLRVADAFSRHADIDLGGALERDALAREARRIGIEPADDDAFDDVFFRIFLERIEPHLGPGPLFLYDYPPSMAVMARIAGGWAQRVELFIDGVELANGFSEETDASEQRRRFEADRAVMGMDDEPLDEAFLEALDRMPEAAGIAIGLDRLFMVLARATALQEVMLFPFEPD